MLLSIGMIVKNEEKYLDRCLAAIKPILDSIDSELIIADTGSTDRTVEIAKKYTDNVFYFEWIKDFAAARNSTLDRAKGEWYMFLDADEIFQSCDDIIKFFKSGKYKKFNTARYTVRSFSDPNMKIYSDVLVPRLTRRKGVRFNFPVHEELTPFNSPTMILADIADHYGYVYEDEKSKEEKFKRNTELLEERLKNEKNPPLMLYLQLYQSYNITKNEKREYYLEIGMEKSREKKDFLLVPFYGEKVAMLYSKECWEELNEAAKEYFALPKDYRPYVLGSDAEVHIYNAIALRNLERYEEAIPEYCQGIKLLKDIVDKKLITSDMMLYCFSVAMPANLPGLMKELTYCCLQTKEFTGANEAIQYLGISDLYVDEENDKAVMRLEFVIMNGIGDYSRAERLYKELNDNGRLMLQAFVRSCIETHKEPLSVIPFFKKLYKKEAMMSALLEMLETHFSTGDSGSLVSKMIADGYGAYYELLYFMMSEGQDIHALLRDDFDLHAAAVFCRNLFEDMYQIAENYSADKLESREAILAALRVYETFMGLMAEDNKDIEGVFTKWGEAGAKLCGMEELDNLPAQVLGAALANNFTAARKQKNYRICAAAMKMMLKTYPEAKPIVSALNSKIQKELAEMNKPKQVTEMDILAQTVKENIADLIKKGDFQQAGQLLDEFSSLMPNDPEIAELRKQMAQ